MTEGSPRRIAFLGFGLIAGSAARALAAGSHRTARPELVGWSPSNSGPLAAVRAGVLDTAAGNPGAALDGADLVVVGAPPIETIELVEALGGSLRSKLAAGAVVTDVASTKVRVVAAADSTGLPFVGGHPMAGREVAGYDAATPDLFAGRPWVLVPGAAADSAAVDRVAWLAVACGARPVLMGAAAHDTAVAAISHVPLVLAAALVEAVAGAGAEQPGWSVAAPLAASGWRDMTRLARGDSRMGTGIAVTNADALVQGLRAFRAVLDEWIEELARDGGPEAARLDARLRAVRDRLEGTFRNPAVSAAPELVLVIPRAALMDDPGWLGVRTDGLDAFEDLVTREARYVPRPSAEHDRSLKQVIPYLVLRDGGRYFLMRRTRAGADARLHDRYTIGVGGHLNPGDGGLAAGLRREWDEELAAAFSPEFHLVGLLNDDTTDVGSVHLGAVYVADAGGRRVEIREVDKLRGAFADPNEVEVVVERMESWSRLIFDHLEHRPPADPGVSTHASS